MAESTIADECVLDVLRASAVFGSLDEAVLLDLRRLLVLQLVPGGHIGYREGDQANTMFFLFSGRLRVSRRGPDGELQHRNSQILVVLPLQVGAAVHAVALSLAQAFARVGRAFHGTPQHASAPDTVVAGFWQGKDRHEAYEEPVNGANLENVPVAAMRSRLHDMEPPDASFPLMGYNRAAQIVEVGCRYAMQEIATWTRSGGEAK